MLNCPVSPRLYHYTVSFQNWYKEDVLDAKMPTRPTRLVPACLQVDTKCMWVHTSQQPKQVTSIHVVLV